MESVTDETDNVLRRSNLESNLRSEDDGKILFYSYFVIFEA